MDKGAKKKGIDARVQTGEWGFCERCGGVSAVVVGAQDRLQFRLVKAETLLAKQRGELQRTPLEQLRKHLQELYVSSSVAVALANYGLVGLDTQNPRQASRSAVIELQRRMREQMTDLVVAEANLATWLGQPIDLLREATEELEKETDFVAEQPPAGERGGHAAD